MAELKPTDTEAIRQEIEWRKCEADPAYFFQNYYYIPVVGIGPKPLDMRDYQIEVLEAIKSSEHIISLKARQIGMTTIMVAYAVWSAIFHVNTPWLFVSRNEKAAIKMLSRAKYAMVRLPPWIKQRIGNFESLTQTAIELPNGSYLESVPATSSTGRGDSVYGAILDECAYMELAEDIWAAVEPLVYGKALLVSTANGMGNFFHDTWLDSELSDSIWNGIFYPWDVVPSRDEKWYRERALAYRGREWYFYQEYPTNPTEAFAKSGRLAFSLDLMDYCDFSEPELRLAWEGNEFYELSEGEIADIVLNVWEEPTVLLDENGLVAQPPNYVVGVDVAEGLEHGDFSVIKVFDANTEDEVASCISHIPVEDLGFLIEAIGYWYHTALVIVERNNHGLVPLTYLKNQRYPRLYRPKTIAKRESTRREEYGWHTNRKSKPKMIKDMLFALRTRSVGLRDEQFRHEAQTFVSDGKGGYAANRDRHDDVIMATLIAWQGCLDVERFPIVWADHSPRPLTFDDVFGAGTPKPRSLLNTPLGDSQMLQAKSFVFMHELNRQK